MSNFSSPRTTLSIDICCCSIILWNLTVVSSVLFPVTFFASGMSAFTSGKACGLVSGKTHFSTSGWPGTAESDNPSKYFLTFSWPLTDPSEEKTESKSTCSPSLASISACSASILANINSLRMFKRSFSADKRVFSSCSRNAISLSFISCSARSLFTLSWAIVHLTFRADNWLPPLELFFLGCNWLGVLSPPLAWSWVALGVFVSNKSLRAPAWETEGFVFWVPWKAPSNRTTGVLELKSNPEIFAIPSP